MTRLLLTVLTSLTLFTSCVGDSDTVETKKNEKPTLSQPINEQSYYVGTQFSYDVSQKNTTFTAPEGTTLKYSIKVSPPTNEISFSKNTISGSLTKIGTYIVTVYAENMASLMSETTYKLEVLSNTPPILSTPNNDVNIFKDVYFSFDASKSNRVFSDIDNEQLEYDLVISPENEQIKVEGAVVSGIISQEETFSVVITATDQAGLSAEDSFKIEVKTVNQCNSFTAPKPLDKLDLVPKYDVKFPIPTGMVFHGSDAIVTSRAGYIQRVTPNGKVTEIGQLKKELGVISTRNLEGSQQAGLTSLAIAPKDLGSFMFIAVNGKDSKEAEVTSRVLRYAYNATGILPDSRELILEIKQTSPWHHIGQILFDKDGYLLIGIGDGNATIWPDKYGAGSQDLHDLRGKILRIDVRSLPYTIPSDNPLVGTNYREEIYAYGLRNPWRFSIDSLTNEIWIGEVGNTVWEEINILKAGANYGWPFYEGPDEYNCPKDGCSKSNVEPPIFSYTHNVGVAIIGGYVYRGSKFPELYGAYIFGDYVSDTIYALDLNDTGEYQMTAIAGGGPGLGPSSFGESPDKEIYVVQRNTNIFEFQRRSDFTHIDEVPTLLSKTGCVNMHSPFDEFLDIAKYNVNSPLWSDGAEKHRFLSLPTEKSISIHNDKFTFPKGTTLIKTFSYEGKPHETRLMINHKSGWAGYSYEWDDKAKEAYLLVKSKTKKLQNDIDWTFPSRSNCFQCHTEISGKVLGFEPAQLNSTTIKGDNQLEKLVLKGVLNDIDTIDMSLKLANLKDDTASSTSKFKSYVHSNCAFCHQPNGTASSLIDFRFNTPLEDMNVCDVVAEHPLTSHPKVNKIIDPSEALNSALFWRINALGAEQMPPVGRRLIDKNFADFLKDWIDNEAGNCTN